MDNEVTEIQQHPAACRRAFAQAKVAAFGLQLLFEVVGQGAKLEKRLRCRNHEEIRKRGRTRNIEQRDVQGLALGKNIDGLLGQLLGFQLRRSIPEGSG